MKWCLFLAMLLMTAAVFAQSSLPNQCIRISAGYSRTGSGDIPGFIYGIEYSKYFKNKMTWAAGFNGFIYDGSSALFATADPNGRANSNMRYTTAGLQANGQAGFNIIRTRSHELQFRLGALIKYQSASVDGYSIVYPPVTNYPEPVVTFYNDNPQRTLAVGGAVQVLYSYTIKRNISIGIITGAQTDSRGDVITQAGVTLGRKF